MPIGELLNVENIKGVFAVSSSTLANLSNIYKKNFYSLLELYKWKDNETKKLHYSNLVDISKEKIVFVNTLVHLKTILS